MKRSNLRALLLAISVSAFPHTSSASILLAGWYDFNGNNDPAAGSELAPEAADVTFAGFSGNVDKGGQFSVGDGGSVSGFYGTSSIAASAGDDGYARVFSTSQLVFSLTNDSGPAFQLDKLFFDARNSNTFTVRYQLSGAPTAVELGTGTSAATSYRDFSFDLVAYNISLLAGQTIDFIFTSPSGTQIDNLGITAIPEPASLLALGCLLGSGLVLRRRPSRLATSVA